MREMRTEVIYYRTIKGEHEHHKQNRKLPGTLPPRGRRPWKTVFNMESLSQLLLCEMCNWLVPGYKQPLAYRVQACLWSVRLLLRPSLYWGNQTNSTFNSLSSGVVLRYTCKGRLPLQSCKAVYLPFTI